MKCDIKIYTLSGEQIETIRHDGLIYKGEGTRWFQTFSGGDATLSGGEHAWDLISQNDQALASGMYLFSVKDLESGKTEIGKFIIIK